MENSKEIVKAEKIADNLIKGSNINYAAIIGARNSIQWTYESHEKVLMANPPSNWVKLQPYAKTNYLPIEKVELLLKVLFKRHRIEILREGQTFNGIYMVVRVHYLHPVSDEWEFQDGTSGVQLQTKKGSSPADLVNINNGALSMAFPSAKSYAIKDACENIGNIFGANLNRKDVVTLENVMDAESHVKKIEDLV